MFNREKILLIIEKGFPYFLACQVLIDIITTLFVHKLHLAISFGMIVRFLFIFIATIYIFLKKKNNISKILLILLILLNIYQLVYLYMKVPNLDIFSNIRYYLRTSYYPVILIFLYDYKDKMNSDKVLNIINFNILLITITYIMAIFTDSGLPMYDNNLYGTSAWFSSGNEISTIMTILSLITLFNFLRKENILNFIILISTVFILVMIGTKNSLVALIMLLIMSIVTILYSAIKNKKNLKYLFIFLLIPISISIFYKELPAYKNITYVATNQKDDNLKNSYSDQDEIPKEIIEKREGYIYKDTNDFIASINLNLSLNQINQVALNVNGYFYPKYFDLSHPKYVEKTLILYNDANTYEFKLTDTYNKHLKEVIDKDYNPDFGGLSGYFLLNDDFNFQQGYNAEIIVKIDGLEKRYNIIENITTDQNTVKKINNKINFYPELAAKPSTCVPIEINIPLLSGRTERVSNFVSCNPNYQTYQLIFGSGYIKNFIDSNGFEMDIIEIFITYGITGFIIYFAMTFIILIKICINIFKNPSCIFKDHNYLLLLSILVGFGLALLVGHTLLTPAPAIYLALLMIITLLKTREDNQNEK